MGVAVSELTEPGPGQPIQGPPQDVMVQPPYVKANSARASFGADDVYRLGRQRGRRSDVVGFRTSSSDLFSHDDRRGDFREDVTQKKGK